jgi:uracil-DNA glycosylase
VLQINSRAKMLIVGQAPGRKVHESGISFDDTSGQRLRQWTGMSNDTFYDPSKVAIIPMGLCFSGTGTSGDLTPTPSCAQTWRADLMAQLPHIELTIVLGKYAQDYHLAKSK